MDAVSTEKFGSIARQVDVRVFAHAHGRTFTLSLMGMSRTPNGSSAMVNWQPLALKRKGVR